MKKTLVFFLRRMGGKYEPTHFLLEHEERGYYDHFDISGMDVTLSALSHILVCLAQSRSKF